LLSSITPQASHKARPQRKRDHVETPT
jgi:hypothetical protein